MKQLLLVVFLITVGCEGDLSPLYYAPLLDHPPYGILNMSTGGTPITYGSTLTFPNTLVGNTNNIVIDVCNGHATNNISLTVTGFDDMTNYAYTRLSFGSYIAPGACVAGAFTLTFQTKSTGAKYLTVEINSGDSTYPKSWIFYAQGTGI